MRTNTLRLLAAVPALALAVGAVALAAGAFAGETPAQPLPDRAGAAGEAVLLALALLSPWPFGSVEPPYELALSAGVLLLAALWAAHAALTGRFRFRPDVVSVCLGGLALWSAVQLVPLPEAVVGV